MTHSYKLEAIVLKRTNFFEADRLVTVISKKHGKVVMIAKGVRKLTSRKKGHLELFTHVKLQVVKTKGFGIITEAETITNFPTLRQNLNRVRISYLLAELVDKMTVEEQDHQEVFMLLLDSLTTLDSKTATKNFIVDFETKLLELLGFGLPNPPITQQRLESHISSITDHSLKSKKLR
jgi:DNA repair protein RecO (recombination protein O)